MPAENAAENSGPIPLGLRLLSNSQRQKLETSLARLRIRRNDVALAISSLQHYLEGAEEALHEGDAVGQPRAVYRSRHGGCSKRRRLRLLA
jgi:hypothetical protein